MASISDDIADAATGVVSGLKRGAGSLISSGARALQDVGLSTQGAQDYGNQLVAANPAPPSNGFSDLVSRPVSTITGAIAENAPAIAANLSAGAIGKVAGGLIGGAVTKNPEGAAIGENIGSLAGSGLADFGMFYGGNRQEQDANGIDNKAAAAAAATGQAAVNQLHLLPVRKVLGMPGGRSAVDSAISSLPGGALAAAAKYATVGAGSALAQDALGRLQAGKDATGDDTTYGNDITTGGILGGILGGGSHFIEHLSKPTRDDMIVGHAAEPQAPTVVEPSAGPVSRAVARGADAGKIGGVVSADTVRASLPTFDPAIPQAPVDVAAPQQQEAAAEQAPYSNDSGVSIPAGKDLKPTERVVEQRAAQQVLADPAKAVADYQALPGTDGGRIINTDEAREVFGDYNSGPEARSAFSYAVHEPASWIAKEQYQQRLAQPVEDGKDASVMFTAGGTGAGKTTAIKRVPGLEDEQNRADVVYDGNFQSFPSAKAKIDQALASGRKANIVYVNRDPIEAFVGGALPRAAREDYGRTVPIATHADTHIGAAQTLAQLAEHYKDNPGVDIRVVNNEKDGAKVGDVTDVSHVAGMDRDKLISELNNGLDQQREAGKVPDRVFDFYRGDAAGEDGNAGGDRGVQPLEGGAVGREGQGGEADAVGGRSAEQGQGLDGARASAVEDDQTQTPEFKSWFGESKIADESGNPIRVYHGTTEDVASFDPSLAGLRTGNKYGKGAVFFTDNPRAASAYAISPEGNGFRQPHPSDKPNVVPAYLSLKNPLEIDAGGRSWTTVKDRVSSAQKSGHDGVIVKNVLDHASAITAADEGPISVYVAFHPEQIKSALGNSGKFDPTNPDIRARAVDPNVPVNGKGMAPRAVSDLVDRQTKNWKSGPAVEVVPTNAHLPADLRAALGNKNVNGAYDGNGKIYVVADHVNSAKDVRSIIAHEAYAHYGVKGVLGKEFPEFLSKITALKDIDPDIAKAYAATESRYGNLSPEARADEVVAHMAENFDTLKGRAKALVSRVVAAVKDFLRKTLNIQSEMSAHDVRAIIAKAKGALSEAKPVERAPEPPAVARASAAAPPAPAESFEGWTRPSANLDRYLGKSAADRLNAYKAVAGQKTDALRTVLQDYFLPVKRTQEAIETRGGKIEDASDVYGREELYYGRTGARLQKLEDDHVKPLINDLAKSGVSQDDAELYLYAKFAPERNERIASINPELPDGGSGMTNEDAAKIIDDFKKQGIADKLDKIAERVYALNEERVKALEESGLISEEEAKAWREDKHYVPLKGFAEGVEDEAPATRLPAGGGFSVGGKEAWKALGRRSRATDLIANAVAQTDQAIIRAEKNRVAQALLKLARDNPNESLWAVDATQRKAGYDKNTGEVVYRHTNEPDAVVAKVNGEEFRINIRDPRLLESIKNMGAAKVGAVLRTLGAANRFLSMMRTTLSPEFVLSNFARDIQTAGINLTGLLDAKTAAKAITTDMPHALRAMWGELVQGKRVGGEWGRFAQEFRENGGETHFVNMATVEDQQRKIESMIATAQGKKPVAKLIGAAYDAIKNVNGVVENATRLSAYAAARRAGASIDQSARLAKNITVNFNRKGSAGAAINAMWLFYNASIQGSQRFLSAMKNPKVQGIMASTAALGFGLGYYNRMIGGKDDDGQDYWDKVPDFEKQRNLVILNAFGKGNSLKIPMPYTYNMPYLLGQEMSDMAFGKKAPSTAAANMVNAVINAFDPVGSIDIKQDPTEQIAKLATPTVAQPFLDLAFNKNFAGSPIKPQQDPNAKYVTPDSESYFKGSTNPGAVWLARELNRLSGGNPVRSGGIDVSPASMVYVADYLGGGTSSFFERVITSMWGALKGEPVPVNKIPFVRTFLSQPNDARINDTYYQASDDVNQKIAMAKAYAKPDGGFGDATTSEKQEMRFGASLASALRETDGTLKKINEAKAIARKAGDDKKVDDLTVRERVVMLAFNRAYFSAQERESRVQ